MRWSRLLLVVLTLSATSFTSTDQSTENSDVDKHGWELNEPIAGATAVATKVRLSGLYPAGSLLKDDKAPGGFGPCDNYPLELGAKDWGSKGKVALVAFPEEKVAYFKHQGIALRLINRSEKITAFAAFDSFVYILQEAQDENGCWREIESPPDIAAFCGNSFHRVLLKPGQYWQFPARLYKGELKTKIRFRLDPTSQPGEEPPVYSNEFEGFIDPGQFRTGPDRATLGKAMRSAKATPDVLHTLIEALRDDDRRTRCLSASRLGEFGPAAKEAIPALRTAIKGSDSCLRAEAAAALFAVDTHPKLAIDTLASILQDQDADARRRAVFHLCESGRAAHDAVPALCLALLKERDHRLRYNLAKTLGKIRSRADICVPALVKTLEDSEWIVRSYAAKALGDFGVEAQKAAPNLMKALKDPEGHVRVSSAEALWRIHGKAEPSLNVLIACLKIKREHDYVPDAAAQVLGKMGPSAKDAVPALKEALADKNAWRGSRICAAGALWQITHNTSATMAVFVKELQNPALSYESDTSRMFTFLEEMGPHAKEAVPLLKGLLKRERSDLREAVRKVLKKIEPQGR